MKAHYDPTCSAGFVRPVQCSCLGLRSQNGCVCSSDALVRVSSRDADIKRRLSASPCLIKQGLMPWSNRPQPLRMCTHTPIEMDILWSATRPTSLRKCFLYLLISSVYHLFNFCSDSFAFIQFTNAQIVYIKCRFITFTVAKDRCNPRIAECFLNLPS